MNALDLSPGSQLPLFCEPDRYLASLTGSIDRAYLDDAYCSEEECDCESIDWSNPQSWIAALLSLKYDECECDFVSHLCEHGIKQPLRTALLGDFGVTQGDGHHRLAVAIHERLAWVPLIFCRSTFETCVTCGNEGAEITSCDERLG